MTAGRLGGRSAAQWPDLVPGVAAETRLALRELGAVLAGGGGYVSGDALELRLLLPGAASIAAAPLVIGEIEFFGIVAGDAEGWRHVLWLYQPMKSRASSMSERLRKRLPRSAWYSLHTGFWAWAVTLGGRRTSERYEPEPSPRRFGIAPVAGLVAYEGHEYVHRRPPLALGFAGVVVPVGILCEDLADVPLLLRRRRIRAARHPCQQEHHKHCSRENQFPVTPHTPATAPAPSRSRRAARIPGFSM